MTLSTQPGSTSSSSICRPPPAPPGPGMLTHSLGQGLSICGCRGSSKCFPLQDCGNKGEEAQSKCGGHGGGSWLTGGGPRGLAGTLEVSFCCGRQTSGQEAVPEPRPRRAETAGRARTQEKHLLGACCCALWLCVCSWSLSSNQLLLGRTQNQLACKQSRAAPRQDSNGHRDHVSRRQGACPEPHGVALHCPCACLVPF